MKEKIKIAVIGCGNIANNAHIPAYMDCESAEIKYFCDIIPERADAAVEKYGCARQYMIITKFLMIPSLMLFPYVHIMTITALFRLIL